MDALTNLAVRTDGIDLSDLCSMHSYFNKIERDLKTEKTREIITTLETKILEAIQQITFNKDTTHNG